MKLVSHPIITTTLNISGATTASSITASNVTASSGAFGYYSSNLISDNGSSLYFGYNQTVAFCFGKYNASVGINRDANQGYTLDVIGPVRFSSSCSALSYTTTSDARVKTDVVPASLDECARLAKVTSPMTYLRTDLESTERRIGYIANHWDDALGSGMRNITGRAASEDGTELLALDYSRIVPVLHGALLSVM